MLQATFRFLAHAAIALGVVGVAASTIIAIRLSFGPISVPWLLSYLRTALNDLHPQVSFDISGADVSWLGWDHFVAIRILDLNAFDASGRNIVTIPALAISFSRDAIGEGFLAPEAISVDKPNLWLVRGFDGAMSLAVTEDNEASDPFVKTLIAQLSEPDNPQSLLSYLEQIQITDATLIYTDQSLGASWRARLNSANLLQDSGGILVDAVLETDVRGETAEIILSGAWGLAERKLAASIDFSRLNPAGLAKTAQTLQPLAGVDVPLSGSLQGIFTAEGLLERADFNLQADDGEIHIKPMLPADIEVDGLDTPLGVQSVAADASFIAETGELTVANLTVAFAEGTTLALPQPLSHAMPLSAIRFTGRASEQIIDVSSLELDLDGIVLTANARIQSPTESAVIDVHAETGGVNFDDLHRYWPPSLAPGGHEWVVEHLSNGVAKSAVIDIALAEENGEIELRSVSGRIEADGITVDYLPPLPKFTDAAGIATFNEEEFTIEVLGAHSGNRKVNGGTVVLYDFDKEIERLSLDLSVEGPVRDHLEYINSPPLEFIDTEEVDLDTVKGDALLRVEIDLPLWKDLEIKDVELSIIGELENVGFTDFWEGGDFVDGQLKLSVNTEGLNVDGPLTVLAEDGGNIEVYLVVHENFDPNDTMVRKGRITFGDLDANEMGALGFQTVDLTSFFSSGKVEGDIEYLENTDGTQHFDLNIDLKGADAGIPQFGWHKALGKPGRLQLSGHLIDLQLQAIDPLMLSTEDYTIDARIDVNDGALRQVSVREMRGPLTNLKGEATLGDDGVWVIEFGGSKFNLGPLLADDLTQQDLTEEELAEIKESETDPRDLPDLSLSGDISQIWLGEGTLLENFKAGITVSEGRWRDLEVDANDSAGSPLSARIKPGEPTQRVLEVRGGDAGATLRSLRLYDHVRGGTMSINGTFDDNQPSSPLNGRLKVTDFRLEQAPTLARLLTVTSLTGIASILTGRGISMTELNAPFIIDGDIITLDGARMYGSQLGLTASGTIDTAADTFDIRGTVVPFYTVNSVLGRIPVIGDVFTGGEKGGGLFAATYRIHGTVENPEVSYNALATLAPGFLRNLFNVFEDNTTPPPTDDTTASMDATAEKSDDAVPTTTDTSAPPSRVGDSDAFFPGDR